MPPSLSEAAQKGDVKPERIVAGSRTTFSSPTAPLFAGWKRRAIGTPPAEGAPMAKLDKNEMLAIELTKLVASQAKPPDAGDFFRLSTDYLSVYRYILKDLRDNA